jgi:hypothetical protein
MKSTKWTRRQVLKGAGIALSVPWLETLQAKKAHAAAPINRYVSMYFPNGSASTYWGASGAGATFTLGPILQPLMPNQAKVLVMGNVGNYSPWNGHIEPSHGNNSATSWTGVRANGPMSANSSISIDQAIGNQLVTANNGKLPTALHSLQVGLSTLDSYTDGLPGPHSRSMSWKDAATPLYKIISPQNVYDTLVAGGLPQGGNMTTAPDPAAAKRAALKKSALDYIGESTQTLQARLSKSDVARLDQFLTSVKDLEARVTASGMPTTTAAGCTPLARPTQTAMDNQPYPAGFDRGQHATLMIDLTVMAFQCDLTRVVSFMLDDARSDFVYNFIQEREFTATGSTQGTAPVAGYHGLQHTSDNNNQFATIGWWNVARANELMTKITAVKEGTGTAMDGAVIHLHSGMRGGNHDSLNLPIALLGTGGGVLKTGQYINFPTNLPMSGGKNLQDVHLTILNKVFGGNLAQFGVAMGAFVGTTGVISEILA